jgi:hypothetical protein
VYRTKDPAQHLATIQTLTTRTPRIARDDRQQRLDARPQLVVDLPRPDGSLPRLGGEVTHVTDEQCLEESEAALG